MTSAELRAARELLGFSRGDLAAVLRLGRDGRRLIRRWEEDETPVSGPASVAIEALLSGWRPVDFDARVNGISKCSG